MAKTCSKCLLEKDAGEFYARSARCKACAIAASREYHKANPAVRLKAEQAYRARNPEKSRLSARRSNWVRLGIRFSDAEFEAMLQAQQGVCAICRKPELSKRALAVDHCHNTGKIRGLLCYKCNSAIGKLGDDPTLLRAALAYLERP